MDLDDPSFYQIKLNKLMIDARECIASQNWAKLELLSDEIATHARRMSIACFKIQHLKDRNGLSH